MLAGVWDSYVFWLAVRVLAGPLWAGASILLARKLKPGWAAVVPPLVLALLPAGWMAHHAVDDWLAFEPAKHAIAPSPFEAQVLFPGALVIAAAFGLALVGRTRRYGVTFVLGSVAGSAWVSLWFPVVLVWRREPELPMPGLDWNAVRVQGAVGAALLLFGALVLAVRRVRGTPGRAVPALAWSAALAGSVLPFLPPRLPASVPPERLARLVNVVLADDGTVLVAALLAGEWRCGALVRPTGDGGAAAVLRRPLALAFQHDFLVGALADGRIAAAAEMGSPWPGLVTAELFRLVTCEPDGGRRTVLESSSFPMPADLARMPLAPAARDFEDLEVARSRPDLLPFVRGGHPWLERRARARVFRCGGREFADLYYRGADSSPSLALVELRPGHAPELVAEAYDVTWNAAEIAWLEADGSAQRVVRFVPAGSRRETLLEIRTKEDAP